MFTRIHNRKTQKKPETHKHTHLTPPVGTFFDSLTCIPGRAIHSRNTDNTTLSERYSQPASKPASQYMCAF